jgi:hypothetical protein
MVPDAWFSKPATCRPALPNVDHITRAAIEVRTTQSPWLPTKLRLLWQSQHPMNKLHASLTKARGSPSANRVVPPCLSLLWSLSVVAILGAALEREKPFREHRVSGWARLKASRQLIKRNSLGCDLEGFLTFHSLWTCTPFLAQTQWRSGYFLLYDVQSGRPNRKLVRNQNAGP